jgi:hypothetical protein
MDRFTEWFTRLGGPLDMAMFFTQEPGDDFVTYYLSPATEVRAPPLLRALGGQPGEAPPKDPRYWLGKLTRALATCELLDDHFPANCAETGPLNRGGANLSLPFFT